MCLITNQSRLHVISLGDMCLIQVLSELKTRPRQRLRDDLCVRSSTATGIAQLYTSKRRVYQRCASLPFGDSSLWALINAELWALINAPFFQSYKRMKKSSNVYLIHNFTVHKRKKKVRWPTVKFYTHIDNVH